MIFLHVGKPKTGTSTLQKFLKLNQLNLLKQKVLYPSTGMKFWGHHNIYYDLACDPKFELSLGSFEQLITKISNYKSKYPESNIILSSEAFCTMQSELFAELFVPLNKIDKCKVIIYLRNQVDYLKSFWSHKVRNKRTQFKFAQWAPKQIETNASDCNYLLVINELANITSDENLKIVVYDDIPKVDFVNYFLELCNVKLTPEFHQLDSLINNASSLTSFPIPESISHLCTQRYNDSNNEIARRFLSRDYLFRQEFPSIE